MNKVNNQYDNQCRSSQHKDEANKNMKESAINQCLFPWLSKYLKCVLPVFLHGNDYIPSLIGVFLDFKFDFVKYVQQHLGYVNFDVRSWLICDIGHFKLNLFWTAPWKEFCYAHTAKNSKDFLNFTLKNYNHSRYLILINPIFDML